jgi:hypothetical protein
MTLERWNAGQPWPGPSAAEHNAVVDCKNDLERRRLSLTGEPLSAAAGLATTVIRVANYTGGALLPGGVVVVRELVTPSTTDADRMRTEPLPKAYVPTSLTNQNRTPGVVVIGCANEEGAIAWVCVAGAAVVKVVAGSESGANASPKLLAVIADSTVAAHPTADPAQAFARVIDSPAAGDGAYALAIVGPQGGGGAQLKFARSTGANQEQQSLANNLIGTVEALPVDVPGGIPPEGAQPIVLAVIGQCGQTWGDGFDLRRFHLPANAQIAYVESTAYSGAVGVVVHDYDDDLSYELYWGKVRGVDNQGTMEPELRDSGHFAMPKQVKVDVLNTATGGVATGSPTAWILLPKAATRSLKVGDQIVFRQEFALRAGDVDPIVSSINWGDATWSGGRFVAINVGSVDDDCGQFGCGVAVGVDVPRTESTGILRMFRGKRPDLAKPMSATNRAPYELQVGVNTLGRWLGSQSGAKIGRITFPGLPYGNFREPAGGFPWWTRTDGTQMPNIFRTVYTGRHLVSRRLTANKNGVHMDWSPPTYSGGLYLMSAGNDNNYGNGAMTNGNFSIMYLTVRDGLILGGVTSTGGNIASGIYNFNRDTGAGAIASLSDPDDWEMPLDTGCCPKYDAAVDVTQGP